ncbi:hypothetical protein C4T29_01445, partial [Clostridioides difficile]
MFNNRENLKSETLKNKYIQIRVTENEKEDLKNLVDKLNEDNSKKISLTDFILNAIDYYIEHEYKNYKKK